MADYQTNAREVLAYLFTDAPKAADLLLDIGDELIDAGRMEALADGVKEMLEPYLTTVLQALQDKLDGVEIAAED